MKTLFLKKVDRIMVKTLMGGYDFSIEWLQEMEEFNKKAPFKIKKEVIEEYRQGLQEQEAKQIVLDGNNQYVINYDDINNSIIFEDKKDEFSFGVGTEHIDFDDFYTFDDIVCCLNDKIKDYFGDKIIEDCGEYWEIKE